MTSQIVFHQLRNILKADSPPFWSRVWGHISLPPSSNVYLNDLISQSESSVGGGDAFGMDVIDEDVCEGVLDRVLLVAERQSQPLVRRVAMKKNLLEKEIMFCKRFEICEMISNDEEEEVLIPPAPSVKGVLPKKGARKECCIFSNWKKELRKINA